MDVNPVTVGQYQAFIKARQHPASSWLHIKINVPTNDYPIIYINWHDARAYPQWKGKCLPTGAKWE